MERSCDATQAEDLDRQKCPEALPRRIAQKIGEEGVEVALAAVQDFPKDEFVGECADLIFHLMVLLEAKKCSLDDVISVLVKRHAIAIQE